MPRTIKANGNVIQHQRIHKGWSVEELASKAGVSSETIENLEACKNAYLSTFAKLASALGLQPKDVIDSELPPQIELPKKVTFKIDVEEGVYNETELFSYLLDEITKREGGEDAMEPKNIRKGCIEIDVDMTSEQAARVLKAFREGKLDGLGIISVACDSDVNFGDAAYALAIDTSRHPQDVFGFKEGDTFAVEYEIERIEIDKKSNKPILIARNKQENRLVAINVISTTDASRKDIDRFIRESRILHNLSPNLVASGEISNLVYLVTVYEPSQLEHLDPDSDVDLPVPIAIRINRLAVNKSQPFPSIDDLRLLLS